jgi:hypothetical protein
VHANMLPTERLTPLGSTLFCRCALLLLAGALLWPWLAPLPVAASTPPLSALVFNEVLARPMTDWDHDGLDDPPTDAYVEFANQGPSPFPLSTVMLGSGPGSYPVVFPLWATVPPYGFFVAFVRQYPHLQLWPSGGEVRLLPVAGGAPFATLRYPALGIDQAYSRTAAGTWTTADSPSPGGPNLSPTPAPSSAAAGSGTGASGSPALPTGPAFTPIAAARQSAVGQWVTVAGQVTAPFGTTGANRLFLQDGSGGIGVSISGQIPPPLIVGDWAAAHGILQTTSDGPALAVPANGTLQWDGIGALPAPIALAPGAAAAHDDQLVSIGGTVLATGPQMFTVAAPGTHAAWCVVRWADPNNAGNWRLPAAGTAVTLTGILMRNTSAAMPPWALWLRSPLDLQGTPASALWGMPLALARAAAPGTVATIVAQVTMPPGIIGAQTLYVADASGGLRVQLPEVGAFWPSIGEWLALSGTVGRTGSEPALTLAPNVPARVLGLGSPPQPVRLTTLATLPRYEGQLVQVTGRVAAAASNQWLVSADGAQVSLRVAPSIAAALSASAKAPVTLVGVVAAAPTGLVLVPRDAHDILASTSATARTGSPATPAWSVAQLLAGNVAWWLALLCAGVAAAGTVWWCLPRLMGDG